MTSHDHFADVRYHSQDLSSTNKKEKLFYHNILVSPGISPIKGQNPGIATFDIDKQTMTPQNLNLIFLPLELTYGWSSVPAVSAVPFREVNLASFGLFTLTANALHDFKKKLDDDDQLTLKYLVAKVGFDPSDSKEYNQGISIY